MSPIDQSIRPALTPDEWAIVEAEKGYATLERADLLGRVDQFGRVAAYNATLPDDHPGKLTRADMQACLNASPRTWNDPVHGEPPAALATLAAKLAALLPPA